MQLFLGKLSVSNCTALSVLLALALDGQLAFEKHDLLVLGVYKGTELRNLFKKTGIMSHHQAQFLFQLVNPFEPQFQSAKFILKPNQLCLSSLSLAPEIISLIVLASPSRSVWIDRYLGDRSPHPLNKRMQNIQIRSDQLTCSFRMFKARIGRRDPSSLKKEIVSKINPFLERHEGKLLNVKMLPNTKELCFYFVAGLKHGSGEWHNFLKSDLKEFEISGMSCELLPAS